MKDNHVNGIRRHILGKHMYFSPCINLNNIVDNANKNRTSGKKGNEIYQYKAYN